MSFITKDNKKIHINDNTFNLGYVGSDVCECVNEYKLKELGVDRCQGKWVYVRVCVCEREREYVNAGMRENVRKRKRERGDGSVK